MAEIVRAQNVIVEKMVSTYKARVQRSPHVQCLLQEIDLPLKEFHNTRERFARNIYDISRYVD